MKDKFENDLPGDDDVNVGDGSPKKKKEKRRKSKEERVAERRVVFWTLFVVVIITIAFWIVPMIKDGSFKLASPKVEVPNVNISKPEWKSYVEYKL